VPPAVFAGFAVVYVLGCARTVQGGDAAEFMMLAARGGVAHPPGYPLFSLLLRASHALLPGLPPPFSASLPAALSAAAALGLLTSALTRLTTRPGVAAICSISLGISPIFWRYATVAEVFALGALTAALLIAVAVRVAAGWKGPRAQFALGLALAAGIANHHTVILLAPLIAWSAWASLQKERGPRRALAEAALAFGLGVLPGFLLYLPLMLPGGGWRWGETGSFAGLVRHFLRSDYGTLQLALSEETPPPAAHLLLWLRRIPADFSFAFAGFAGIGLAAAGARGPRGLAGPRGLRLAVLASLLLAGPLFLSRVNVAESGLGRVVGQRFQILPDVLLAFFAGTGLAALMQRLPARAGRLLLAALAPLLLGLAPARGRDSAHAEWTPLDDYLRNVLTLLPEGALVLVSSDNFAFGGAYLQDVEGLRRDVVLLHPRLLAYPWYRQRLRTLHPDFEPESLTEARSIPELIAESLPRRAVYLSPTHALRPKLAARIPESYPEGAVLFRVPPEGAALPAPSELERATLAVAARYRFRSFAESEARARDSWESWALQQYALCWRALAAGYEAEGDAVGAERARAWARRFWGWD
jgi:hypothetical protein